MTAYEKGARRERELLDELIDGGFVGLRAPTSGGSTDRELPDILVGNGERIFAVEVKSSSDDKIYINKEEVEDLEFFAEKFGATPLIGVKFDYRPWGFFKKEELRETKKSYRVDEFKSPKRGIESICR